MDDENRNFAKKIIPHRVRALGAVSPLTAGDPRTLTTGCGPHSVESRALGVRRQSARCPGSQKIRVSSLNQTIRYTSDSPLEGATRVYTPLRSHLKTTPNPIYSPIFLPSPPPDMVFPVYITMGNTTSMRASIRIACTWPRRDLLARSPRMPRRHSDAASDAPPPSNLCQNHAPTGHYPAPALPTPLPPGARHAGRTPFSQPSARLLPSSGRGGERAGASWVRA